MKSISSVAGYERWEVCISAKMNINSYVGYVRAQFFDDKRQFVIVKARGLAIENALKVVQLVKENMGDIHSQSKFYLMTEKETNKTKKCKPFDEDGELNPEFVRPEDEIMETWEQFENEKIVKRRKVLPALEIILSRQEINPTDPGY